MEWSLSGAIMLGCLNTADCLVRLARPRGREGDGAQLIQAGLSHSDGTGRTANSDFGDKYKTLPQQMTHKPDCDSPSKRLKKGKK